jgi:type II secretory pathway component PulF
MAFLWEFVPRLQDAYLGFHFREHDTLKWLGEAAGTAAYWGPVLPVGMALLMGWWIFSQRATFAFGERLGDPLNQVPILRGVMRQVRIANFSELLALMVEHQIPLADGLLLAGAASGDRRIKAGAVLLAEGQNRGESLEASASTLRVFPPVLRWILMSAQKPETLVPALHQTAEHYRRRAERRADWVKLVLPVVAVVVVGGGATFLYTLALFLPLRELLTDLGLS